MSHLSRRAVLTGLAAVAATPALPAGTTKLTIVDYPRWDFHTETLRYRITDIDPLTKERITRAYAVTRKALEENLYKATDIVSARSPGGLASLCQLLDPDSPRSEEPHTDPSDQAIT